MSQAVTNGLSLAGHCMYRSSISSPGRPSAGHSHEASFCRIVLCCSADSNAHTYTHNHMYIHRLYIYIYIHKYIYMSRVSVHIHIYLHFYPQTHTHTYAHQYCPCPFQDAAGRRQICRFKSGQAEVRLLCQECF